MHILFYVMQVGDGSCPIHFDGSEQERGGQPWTDDDVLLGVAVA